MIGTCLAVIWAEPAFAKFRTPDKSKLILLGLMLCDQLFNSPGKWCIQKDLTVKEYDNVPLF